MVSICLMFLMCQNTARHLGNEKKTAPFYSAWRRWNLKRSMGQGFYLDSWAILGQCQTNPRKRKKSSRRSDNSSTTMTSKLAYVSCVFSSWNDRKGPQDSPKILLVAGEGLNCFGAQFHIWVWLKMGYTMVYGITGWKNVCSYFWKFGFWNMILIDFEALDFGK
jgi:hypothetical protein